jgi:cytochrome o ubiquinol oxidase subunit IV
MENDLKTKEITKQHSLKSYFIGFILSIGLTIAAFIPVMIHVNTNHILFSHEILLPLILGIAVIQLIVQLVFFLHLGFDSKSRWNLVFFVSTVSIVLLIVIASIWIMSHLNYNMMPKDMNSFILNEEGIHK